ncbi:uncharacterized protein [Spinacia oleracea]|uniref:Retrotransposon Copia-like N-terminal domain-containing protein n=1 Tax=Spinacia oleracea TaxID=3562 RepID=A0ABM3RRQ3_SPIOL|nr:uncharacterized protein LOC130471956 [Spinacia oleracea]
MADSKLHPATTVTNIKTTIPIILDFESAQYINWATIFKLHTRANLVIDHIIPSTADAAAKDAAARKEADPTLWNRLDDIVLQWIYGTISNDILNTIIEQEDKAADAWKRLEDLFQDNKAARAIHLERVFLMSMLTLNA